VSSVSTGPYSHESGKLVGYKIRFTNVGSTVVDEYPDNVATLVTDQGEQGRIIYTSSEGSNCSNSSDVKLTPGSSQVACVPFSIPSDQSPSKLQIALSSGYARDLGVWNVAK
jgi:hypothetical protein